jgi:hypothetical protein
MPTIAHAADQTMPTSKDGDNNYVSAAADAPLPPPPLEMVMHGLRPNIAGLSSSPPSPVLTSAIVFVAVTLYSYLCLYP